MMKNRFIISVLFFFLLISILSVCFSLSLSPLVLKNDLFVFEYGEEIIDDVSYYIYVNDSFEDVELDLSDVSEDVGEYYASICYGDSSYEFDIHIKDSVKPKVTLKNNEYKIASGGSVSVYDFINSISDMSDTMAYFDNNDKKDSKYFDNSGVYVENIIVEDIYGNCSSSMRVKVIVSDDMVAPVIYGVEDVVIKQYDYIDLYEGVYVIDAYDGSITDQLVITGDVENGVKGDYFITYYVKDSHGNECSVIRKVSVR